MADDTSNAQGSALTPPAGQHAGATNSSGAAAPQARVALIGRAGAGKTTLARALFRADPQPIDSGVRYQEAEIPLAVDDLLGWFDGDDRSVSALAAALEAARFGDPPLVAIWYALDASSARVTEYELQVIEQLAQRLPLLVVLTRSDLAAAEALSAMEVAIEMADIPNFQAVVAVAADPLPALDIAPFGLGELVELTALAVEEAPTEPTMQSAAQSTAQSAARTAERQQARQAPERNQAGATAPHAQRETSRERFTREQANGAAGQIYAAPERSADQSGAVVALVIIVSLALALLLLWRRLHNAAPPEEEA